MLSDIYLLKKGNVKPVQSSVLIYVNLWHGVQMLTQISRIPDIWYENFQQKLRLIRRCLLYFTSLHSSRELHSSVGRASHRYCRGHGFESRWSLDFFRLPLYCDDHLHFDLQLQFKYMNYFIYISYILHIKGWFDTLVFHKGVNSVRGDESWALVSSRCLLFFS